MPQLLNTERGDERTLVRLAASGSIDALGSLFDIHSAEVYRFAYRILGNRDEAEDTVQDVFIGLPRALARYGEADAFLPWLHRVTVRTALIRLRTGRRRMHREQLSLPDEASRMDDALRMTLDGALTTLPLPLREVAVLRLVTGYTHEEIAGMLDISVSASKVRLHRALTRLRTHLKDSL